MYYPVGWPKVLKIPQENVGELKQALCNRDKILTAVLTSDSLIIWYVKPCVPIISHRRSEESVRESGENVLVQWKPDSSMLVVVTSLGYLIIYHLVVPTDIKTLYELVESSNPALRRESDELFIKENIPPLIFSLAFEVEIEGGISDIVAIREELMIATLDGHIRRYSWEGQEIRDYSLDLRRIPFCVDQQVLKAVPLADKGVYVKKIEYSPLLGGYAIVLHDGRAAFLVASTIHFDPNSVTGIWALQLEDATTIALNHKYKLMAFGRKNSEGVVYNIDEMTGGLVVAHRLILPTRDYPGCPGGVTSLRWTPDGTALAMTWARGGFSIWSTFGAMIMCSLCWDYGSSITDPVSQNPLCIKTLDWSAEGYQLWIINAKKRTAKESDPEFMPLPSNNEHSNKDKDEEEDQNYPLANKALIMQFAKSPISVNPCMSKQQQIYLQAEDRLYVNLSWKSKGHQNEEDDEFMDEAQAKREAKNNSLALMSAGGKIWTTVTIPHNYIGNSWPIRYTALDDNSDGLAVAGRTGFAHYSLSQRKWRLFGNETQEKDFIVTGGLLWWENHIIMGCYNLSALQDEIRIYPKSEKLDNLYARVVKTESQVLLINVLHNYLIVFSADNQITVYTMKASPPPTVSSVQLTKAHTFDCNLIPGLKFHPACVILVALTNLKTETTRYGNRDSAAAAAATTTSTGFPNIILNVCGRVVMVRTEERLGERELSLPTILASNCETIWFPRKTNPEKPHLTASLWLYCGDDGMRVWLPVFPREGDHGHTFMSKRIMLHFPLQKFYPLAILFEDAIILGTESDTILFGNASFPTTALPYCTLERTSLLFLHPILRQLIRRNLGFHAWEIARTCMTLPYFAHSLELLLHEVLEEEATSTEPIPDALLPSVVEFIQEFPVYHTTIGRCARKTEVALWPHLFATVGSPRTLFVECLNRGDLETAATYLLILQNLELPAVAQNNATLLLDAALDRTDFGLAKELIRFLRSIDPNDVEEASQRPLANLAPYGMTPQTPPIVPGPEDEISILLGTLQVPRGRSTSIVSSPAVKQPSPKDRLIRSNSEAVKAPLRTRKISTSSQKEVSDNSQSAEEFFIDVILQRHARKLLSQCRLFDLGTFAANLDFHMVTWLKKETNRAARVDNFVWGLKKIHSDFSWPYPVLFQSVIAGLSSPNGDSRKFSTSSSSAQSHSNNIEDKFRALNVDIKSHEKDSAFEGRDHPVSDSGYLSHPPENGRDSSFGDQGMILSEQTINAMLRPHVQNFREDMSIASACEDVGSLAGMEENSLLEDWAHDPPTKETYIPHDMPNKGPQKSEVQLRYLLQIMLEASCLEIASLISVVLKDALALIRIVNAARSPPNSKNVVSRLYQNIKALEAWAQSECHGYTPFFNAIQPQLNSLRTFLLQQQLPPLPRQNSANLPAKTHNNYHHNIHRSLSTGDNSRSPPLSVSKQVISTVISTRGSSSSLQSAPPAPPPPPSSSSGTDKKKPVKKSVSSASAPRKEIDDSLSVTSGSSSDILPEGQDEQSGCLLS